MWALAVLVGVLVGLVIFVLHGLIAYGQFIAYGASPGRLASRLVDMPWWSRLIAPMVGGALICLLLRLGVSLGWGPSPRTFGLQDVVQHRRLRGTIRSTTMTLRDGFLSAITAVVSLAWGGDGALQTIVVNHKYERHRLQW